MDTKEQIRADSILRRKQLEPKTKERAEQVIQSNLLSLPEYIQAQVLCVYLSNESEVATTAIVEQALKEKKTVVVPKIISSTQLSLHVFHSFTDTIVNQFGVLEPTTNAEQVGVSEIDLFVVPGIAFDRQGHRLGWGKGYYDQLLENVQVPIVGLAFSCQIIGSVPYESHDKKVSIVITEKEILRTNTHADGISYTSIK